MIEKIKQFQESLKKNHKFSDIKLNLKDCYKNFCLDSFTQHVFSKLIILIQLCLIARLFSESTETEPSLLVNKVILFAVGFSTWKIFSVFFEYLNEFSLLKFLKLMNKKDYFSLGVIYRKIIFLSFAYLIVFYVPFVYVIKSTLNNQLLLKSLEINDVCVRYSRSLSLGAATNNFNYTMRFGNKKINRFIRIRNETQDYYDIVKNQEGFNNIDRGIIANSLLAREENESRNMLNNTDNHKDTNNRKRDSGAVNLLYNNNESKTYQKQEALVIVMREDAIAIDKSQKKPNKNDEAGHSDTDFDTDAYNATKKLNSNATIIINENINGLLYFQYLYFFVFLIRIFNKPIQNIFFVFKFNKYLNIMMATKFKINFSVILFCFKTQFSFLNSIFFADLISEIFVFSYLIVIMTLYNPFPQVWVFPSLGIFNFDKSLLQKILKFKKILKFFFLNFWNEFIFILFIYLKVYMFSEHKKFEISMISLSSSIQADKESKGGLDSLDSQFPFIELRENFYKELLNLKINIGNLLLMVVLKDFFFNLSKYTKRNYYKIFLDNLQMISLIKNKIAVEEKNNSKNNEMQVLLRNTNHNQNQLPPLNDFRDFEKNNYNKPLLDKKSIDVFRKKKASEAADASHCFSAAVEDKDKETAASKSTTEDLSLYQNQNTFQQEKHIAKNQNNKLKMKIPIDNHNKNNNENILVVIKNKIFISIILSCIVFINILILYLLGIFSYFNPIAASATATDENKLFDINYGFLFILFLCGSINYLATVLFIINSFLENPNDDKIIIYGFCLFSLLPFLLLIVFISNSAFLFIVINLVNLYFIYTFFDFLSSIDLRFKKIEFLINKEMLEI